MADLDQLLRSDIAAAAADAARVPDFSPLERRGTRQRRVRSTGTAVVAAAIVVVIAATATQFVREDRGATPVTPTTPTPTTPSMPVNLTAEQIVDDPRSRAASIVIAPEDPRIRAVVWRLCLDDRCRRHREAVAVTDDGFRTRSTLVANAFPLYVGGGVFALQGRLGPPLLLHPDGHIVEVTGLQSEPGPPELPGEVIVSYGSGVLRWVAADPTTGRGHPVTVPENLRILRLSPGGRLAGETLGEGSYTWSDNSGATWSSTPLDNDPGLLVFAASRESEPIAVLEGGDGATLFPLGFVHRSTDGGQTFERLRLFDDPMAYGQNAGVLPDGRLLLNIEGWSDDEPGGEHARPIGLHVSNGNDWTDLRPVDGAAPYAEAQPDVVATKDGLLIVYGQEGKASTDGGQTWQDFKLR
ncbi:MAG TPA: sialidase family protein [Nocardioidaceae bacterium]|nr:sialidase family protein [Nocardioidaceae bacterium]